LLSNDGVLFCNLDEHEHAYLKIVFDEVFGRSNFLGDIIWKKRKGGGNDSRFLALDHDYILTYAKNSSNDVHKTKWRVSQSENYLLRYSEIDESGRRYYWDTIARNGLKNPIPVSVVCPDGSTLSIKSQKSQNTINQEMENGTARLTNGRNGWTLHHRVYMPEGQVLRSIIEDVGTNKNAGDEMKDLFGDPKAFPYPKPESLIKRLLELNTSPGDLVLDSFLGSGTTAAVAHKMRRRWIGVELGAHCLTHCLPRLRAVVGGERGGVSASAGWRGGGGFRFYELAPTLVTRDANGLEVISGRYNPDMLAAAVAKLCGYRYAPPGPSGRYVHGSNGAGGFIYVAARFVTAAFLAEVAKGAGGGSLMVCAPAFQPGIGAAHPGVRLRKIPQAVLSKCEYGAEDYNLNIAAPPEFDETLEDFEDAE
jgi:adenine-specific DNA-methyltransferase